jgi:hypothetical protein
VGASVMISLLHATRPARTRPFRRRRRARRARAAAADGGGRSSMTDAGSAASIEALI